MNGDYSEPKIKTKEGTQLSLSDGLFYEIEYDSSPMKGVGKFVLKSQSIKAPEKDEIRELFHRMRDIARQYHPSNMNYSRFFDKRIQQDNSTIFYKQALFMQDFEDNYSEQAPFSVYFPYYQMMGYEQLRTYFTWRTNVRKGIIQPISLSYVFLYLYELLSNVGVGSPQDGLEQLIYFWTTYKKYDPTIDKYVIRWIKDYHIYYNLPHMFKEFVEENNLNKHYPKIVDPQNSFDLFCAISKYDISKSVFFTDETSKLIIDCFNVVIGSVRQNLEVAGIHFDDVLFNPTKKISTWKPFKDALFYQWYKQSNKSVVLSENEIYMCRKNEWTFSTMITSEIGRQFIGYVMKQMESVLRKVMKYKFKVVPNIDMVSHELLSKLNQSGLSIEKIVENAVIDFYRDSTKTIVTVDHTALNRIRQEALSTQEALIVQEHSVLTDPAKRTITELLRDQTIFSDSSDIELFHPEPHSTDPSSANQPTKESTPMKDKWMRLSDTLSENEVQALNCILLGDSIKKFADDHSIMLEVLADGINEKAIDIIGDNILDDELAFYEDYIEQIKEMVK